MYSIKPDMWAHIRWLSIKIFPKISSFLVRRGTLSLSYVQNNVLSLDSLLVYPWQLLVHLSDLGLPHTLFDQIHLLLVFQGVFPLLKFLLVLHF